MSHNTKGIFSSMKNQTSEGINHTTHANKKKNFPEKGFLYLQNDGASGYDYDTAEKKIEELMVNDVIDQSYKIINPITNVQNLPPEAELDIFLEISDGNEFYIQPSIFNSSQITTPLLNETTSAILNTAATPKHHFDEKKIYIKSLEDTLLSKIAAKKSHLFSCIFDLRNDITLLKENNDSNDEKKGCYCSVRKSIFLNQKITF